MSKVRVRGDLLAKKIETGSDMGSNYSFKYEESKGEWPKEINDK